jgi:hypothetical protein
MHAVILRLPQRQLSDRRLRRRGPANSKRDGAIRAPLGDTTEWIVDERMKRAPCGRFDAVLVVDLAQLNFPSMLSVRSPIGPSQSWFHRVRLSCRPAFVPRATGRRQESSRTAGATHPQVRARIGASPQVPNLGSRTRSRWRHGFKSRWDYARQRPCPGLTRASGARLGPPRTRGRHKNPQPTPLASSGPCRFNRAADIKPARTRTLAMSMTGPIPTLFGRVDANDDILVARAVHSLQVLDAKRPCFRSRRELAEPDGRVRSGRPSETRRASPAGDRADTLKGYSG